MAKSKKSTETAAVEVKNEVVSVEETKVEKKVAKLKKIVAGVNSGEISKDKLSPKQIEIVAKVNELTGEVPTVKEGKKLPTKKELAKQKREEAKAVEIPASHQQEIEDLVKEVNESIVENEELKSKKRMPKNGEIIKAPVNEKTGKPWGKFGLHGTNHELEGFTAGDKVMFNLKGVQTEGVFSHFHVNNHSPKGYLVIKIGSKIFERVLEKVTKVSTIEAVVEAIATAKKGKKVKKEEAATVEA